MIRQAASVIIIGKRNDKVLVLKRSSLAKNFNGFWNFPGGSIEQEEEPINAARREVLEETSLTVDAKHLLKLSEHFWDEQNLLVHHYIALKYSGDLLLNNESLDFKWICPDKIGLINFLPIPGDLITKVKKTMNSY